MLRARDGDKIEVIDSAAQRFSARLQLGGKSVTAQLLNVLEEARTDLPEITVAQGMPKGQKMDFVVEKLTELGVSSILPLRSERTIVSEVGANKIERWRRLAKTAAQQCGRAVIPQIGDPVSLSELLATAADYDLVLLPWELAQAVPLRERLPALLQAARRILLIVGPEGGFSHAEAAAAQAAGAHCISLGTRILRTETAALVAVAIVAYVSENRV